MIEEGQKPNIGILDRIRRFTQNKVNQSTNPTEEELGYKSTVGVFGGELKTYQDKLVFDTQNPTAKFDRFGDRILRAYDPHLISHPIRMLIHHPQSFFRFLLPTPERQRGSDDQILANINRLGLDIYYGPHPKGIEIKQPEVIKKGIALQDILRSDQIDSPLLDKVNCFQALAAAATYIRSIHDQYGPIGEIHVSDILFQEIDENGVVSNPILNIPDIVFNPNKQTSETSKKATDLLDILVNLSTEVDRRTKKPEVITQALSTFLTSYADPKVIKTVGSLTRRGRPNIEHPILSQHNQARLNANPKNARTIKNQIIGACQDFLIEN